MKKLLLATSLGISIISCNETPKTNPNENTTNVNIHENKKFFDYNSVEYYYSAFDLGGELSESISTKDSLTKVIALNKQVENISNDEYITLLSSSAYIKRDLTDKTVSLLKDVFIEKEEKDTLVSNCMKVYRDILVFKNDGKITGIAKICFDCDYAIFTETNVKTIAFGQYGEFEKLKSLLNK